MSKAKILSQLAFVAAMFVALGFAGCNSDQDKKNGLVLRDRVIVTKSTDGTTPSTTPVPASNPVVIGEVNELKITALNGGFHLSGTIHLNNQDYLFDAARAGSPTIEPNQMFILAAGAPYSAQSSTALSLTSKYFSWWGSEGGAEYQAAYISAACVHASYFSVTSASSETEACASVAIEVAVVNAMDDLIERKVAIYTLKEDGTLEKANEKDVDAARINTASTSAEIATLMPAH